MRYDLADTTLRKELLLFADEHQLSTGPPQPRVSGKKRNGTEAKIFLQTGNQDRWTVCLICTGVNQDVYLL